MGAIPSAWQRLLGRARHSVDAGFKQRLVNTGHMLSGSAASAVFGLVAVAITARALGPLEYGILALALTFVKAVEQLVTFQSWQPVIRYGATLQEPEQRDDLKQLLKFGLALDLGGALAAAAVSALIIVAGAPLLGWSERVQVVTLICCMSLPFNLTGTPTAVLRLFGKFRLAAFTPTLGAFLRMALCGIGLATGADLLGFAIIWSVAKVIGTLAMIVFAARVLRANGITGVLKAPLEGVSRRFEGLWNFAWSTNFSLAVRSSANQLDVLIVGALAGPAAAGLYHIAKRAAKVAEQATAQIQTVLYPDVARLWGAGETAAVRRAVWQVEGVVFAFGTMGVLFLLVAAEPVLRWTAGPEFTDAAPLLIVQMIAVTLMMTGLASRSALLAMGRQRQVLNIVLVGTLAFHATALLLVPAIGAMGANVAHIVMGLIVSALLIVDFRKVAV